MGRMVAGAVEAMEATVDKELEKYEKMDEDDLEAIREKRLKQMQKLQEKKQEYKNLGHGTYDTITNEKEFFEISKKSDRVVCAFYIDTSFRCKIVDKHLTELCTKHFEARFIRLNAEKAPFLAERLKIKVMPTILMVKDSNVIDRITGFDDLGNTDNFPTSLLEWRIAQNKVINYSGDLTRPPVDEVKEKKKVVIQRNLRQEEHSSDSELDD
eukprot:sb/3470151/